MITRMSGQMLKPTVFLGSMPMLDPFGDVNNVTRQHGDSRFSPLLIPASSGYTDQDLMESVMDVPIVTATWLEGHVGKALYRLLTFGKVLRLDLGQVAFPLKYCA